MKTILQSIIPYLIILACGVGIGYWAGTGQKPVLPDPVIKYIDRPRLNIDRYFQQPARLPDIPTYRFIIVDRPVVEERIVRVPVSFPAHIGLIESNPIRVQGRAMYLRYFDTESGQFRIDQYTMRIPSWNAGINVDLLYPYAIAMNPYVTFRGIGPTAWGLIDADGNGFWYAGLRMNVRL